MTMLKEMLPSGFLAKSKTCNRCKTQLKAHEEFLCDVCDIKMSGTPESIVILPTAMADCWPKKHVRKIEQFHGPALKKANDLLPMVMQGAMLLLHGPQGRGKTGMATWWEWQRLKAGKKPGLFDTVQGVLTRIRASFGNHTTDVVLQELARTPYLVLDEIDERANSEWEEYTLFDLLNRRYNDERATVLISNLTIEELQTSYKPKLLSRINENGGLVSCDWGSYR